MKSCSRFLVYLLSAISIVNAQKVRLLLAYTPSVEAAWATYSHPARNYLISNVITKTNTALSNTVTSGITMPTVELAGIVKVNYAQSSNSNDILAAQEDLDSLRINGDGVLDEIHYLRDIYAADVVFLINNLGRSSVTCDGTNCTGPNDGIGAGSGYAFVVIAGASFVFVDDHVVAHELGHIFGCRHTVNLDPYNLPYAYGHGFENSAGTWGEVMSYNTVRQPWYSNPNKIYFGVASGNTSFSDCARVFDERKSDVSGFRSPVSHAIMTNQTIQGQDYADVVGAEISTSGSVVFQSGSIGRFRATSGININPGFSITSGAVDFELGVSALAKSRIITTEPRSGGQEEEGVFGYSLRQESDGYLLLRYSVKNPVNVSLQAYDIKGRLILKRDFGKNFPGEYSQRLEMMPKVEGLVLVKIRAGRQESASKLLIKPRRVW